MQVLMEKGESSCFEESLLIHKAAALGYLDDVIEPNQTRERLCKALGMLLDKEELRPARKHGNIPL